MVTKLHTTLPSLNQITTTYKNNIVSTSRTKPTNSLVVFGNPNVIINHPFYPIQASSGSDPNQPNSPSHNPTWSFLQDDLNYMWKLGIGSVLGAAAVKYGSAAIPDITRPNLIQALLMIFAPVVVAVVLLIKGSQSK